MVRLSRRRIAWILGPVCLSAAVNAPWGASAAFCADATASASNQMVAGSPIGTGEVCPPMGVMPGQVSLVAPLECRHETFSERFRSICRRLSWNHNTTHKHFMYWDASPYWTPTFGYHETVWRQGVGHIEGCPQPVTMEGIIVSPGDVLIAPATPEEPAPEYSPPPKAPVDQPQVTPSDLPAPVPMKEAAVLEKEVPPAPVPTSPKQSATDLPAPPLSAPKDEQAVPSPQSSAAPVSLDTQSNNGPVTTSLELSIAVKPPLKVATAPAAPADAPKRAEIKPSPPPSVESLTRISSPRPAEVSSEGPAVQGCRPVDDVDNWQRPQQRTAIVAKQSERIQVAAKPPIAAPLSETLSAPRLFLPPTTISGTGRSSAVAASNDPFISPSLIERRDDKTAAAVAASSDVRKYTRNRQEATAPSTPATVVLTAGERAVATNGASQPDTNTPQNKAPAINTIADAPREPANGRHAGRSSTNSGRLARSADQPAATVGREPRDSSICEKSGPKLTSSRAAEVGASNNQSVSESALSDPHVLAVEPHFQDREPAAFPLPLENSITRAQTTERSLKRAPAAETTPRTAHEPPTGAEGPSTVSVSSYEEAPAVKKYVRRVAHSNPADAATPQLADSTQRKSGKSPAISRGGESPVLAPADPQSVFAEFRKRPGSFAAALTDSGANRWATSALKAAPAGADTAF
jgi:hypothetical protein